MRPSRSRMSPTKVAAPGVRTATSSSDPVCIEGLQGLFRISQGGGALQPLTRIDPARKELSHQWPTALADGKSVLFTIWYGAPETAELAITSLDDGRVTPLGVIGTTALGVVDGRVIFVRPDGAVMAMPIDIGNRRTSGSAVQVMEPLSTGESPRIHVTARWRVGLRAASRFAATTAVGRPIG